MSFRPIRIPAHNPGPMTGQGNNTYLLAGRHGEAVLIDAGVGDPRHVAAIDRYLEEHESSLAEVLATHGHADHVSGAGALASAYPGVSFRKYPWPEEDAKYSVKWKPLADGDLLTIGGTSLRAMYTAGHSPDHLVFWHEGSRTAFTGDLVISGGSVLIEGSRGGDLGDYLAALRHLLALRPRVLLPAHGPEIRDPSAVLGAHLEHRLLRERQVMAAIAAGRHTVQAIVESIYDGLDPMLQEAARENVRAHLDKLKREGRAMDHDARWVLRNA